MIQKEFIRMGNAGEIESVGLVERTEGGFSITATTTLATESLRTAEGHVRVFPRIDTAIDKIRKSMGATPVTVLLQA